MKIEFHSECSNICPKFTDCQVRLENASSLEADALLDGVLIEEGEFICPGPLEPQTGEGPFCQGEVVVMPNIRDKDVRRHVETILGPLAIDLLADGDE